MPVISRSIALKWICKKTYFRQLKIKKSCLTKSAAGIFFVIRDYSSFFASFTESLSIKNLSLIFMHNISVLENIRLISNISFVRELGYSKIFKFVKYWTSQLILITAHVLIVKTISTEQQSIIPFSILILNLLYLWEKSHKSEGDKTETFRKDSIALTGN